MVALVKKAYLLKKVWTVLRHGFQNSFDEYLSRALIGQIEGHEVVLPTYLHIDLRLGKH